ncbi:hypothetical protein RIF29_34498 [Crotalaria pallida]|uniref:Transmembrane protein n=1 Tax=Crotalaria pallida TaxID=3830 RepID=A0AAN9EBN8_CROPI
MLCSSGHYHQPLPLSLTIVVFFKFTISNSLILVQCQHFSKTETVDTSIIRSKLFTLDRFVVVVVVESKLQVVVVIELNSGDIELIDFVVWIYMVLPVGRRNTSRGVNKWWVTICVGLGRDDKDDGGYDLES